MLKTTIAMIPVHFTNGKIEILLQRRINSGKDAWFHTWEFPQGKWEKLPEYSFLEFAEYKFKNETGMQLDSIQVSPGKWIRQGYSHCVPEFDPFIITCAEDELALHFFVKCNGKPINTNHADNHRWISLEHLEDFIEVNTICPLNKLAVEKILRLHLSGGEIVYIA